MGHINICKVKPFLHLLRYQLPIVSSHRSPIFATKHLTTSATAPSPNIIIGGDFNLHQWRIQDFKKGATQMHSQTLPDSRAQQFL